MKIENLDRIVGIATVLFIIFFFLEAAGVDPITELNKPLSDAGSSVRKVASDVTHKVATHVNSSNYLPDNIASPQRCFEFVKSNAGNREKQDLGAYACRLLHPLSTMVEPEKSRTLGKCLLDAFSKIQDDTSGTRVATSCAESSKYSSMGMVLAEIFSPSARIQKIIEAQQEEERSRRSADRSLIDGLGLPRSPGNIRIMEGGLPGTFVMDVDGVLKTCNNFAGVVNCH